MPDNPTYSVEFSLHVRYDKGTTTFEREDTLPFVPTAGLVVLDDVVGQFTLDSVAWDGTRQKLMCQGNVDCNWWPLRTAKANLKKEGWIELPDSRMPD